MPLLGFLLKSAMDTGLVSDVVSANSEGTALFRPKLMCLQSLESVSLNSRLLSVGAQTMMINTTDEGVIAVEAGGGQMRGSAQVAASLSGAQITVLSPASDVNLGAFIPDELIDICNEALSHDPCIQLLLSGWSCDELQQLIECSIIHTCHFCDNHDTGRLLSTAMQTSAFSR